TIVTYDNDHLNSGTLTLYQTDNLITSRTGRVSEIELVLSMELLYPHGGVIFTRTLVTDNNGIAYLTLTKSQTTDLESILDISTSIEGEIYYNESTNSVETSELPEIIDSNKDIYESTIVFFIDNASWIIIACLVVFLSSIAIIKIRLIRKRKVSEILMRSKNAEVELNGILSIEMIILQTKTGTPIFGSKFKSSELDTMLVGGITSAISAFLEELGSDHVFGFDVVENQGLSVLSHKTDFSTLVLVSRQKLPILMYNDAERTHRELDVKFNKKLSQSIIGIEEIDEYEFYNALSQHGLKLGLTGNQELKKRNLRKSMRISTFSRNMKQNFQRLGDFVEQRQINGISTSVPQIVDHLETFDLTSSTIAQVILLAYLNKIILQQIDD
ncbi:MAG: hypothetical protein ACXAD7_20920, partial [Candidatus Kariarchaeaceae archaeon]